MVDYKFELCGGLYGQVLRSLTTQDAVDVNRSPPEDIVRIEAIRNQTAFRYEKAEG